MISSLETSNEIFPWWDDMCFTVGNSRKGKRRKRLRKPPVSFSAYKGFLTHRTMSKVPSQRVKFKRASLHP
jgi:hypothetical protein